MNARATKRSRITAATGFPTDAPVCSIVGVYGIPVVVGFVNTNATNAQMIFKENGSAIKDVDTKNRLVKARWSAFGNVDSHNDIIVAGAYDKTIRERGPTSSDPDISFLYQHDPWTPVGVPVEMETNSEGLDVVTKLGRTQAAKDLLLQYEDGIIRKHSVGLDVINSRPANEDGSGPRMLVELKLYEGSAVTFAANPLTPVMELLSDPEALQAETERMADRMSAIRAIMKTDASDDLLSKLEIQLSVWEAQLRALTVVKNVQPELEKARAHAAGSLERLNDKFEQLTALDTRTPVEPRSSVVGPLEDLANELRKFNQL